MATRRERVVLDVESNGVFVYTRDAAAAKLLANTLDGLGRSSTSSSRAVRNASADTDKFAASAAKSERSINQLTGRLQLLAEVSAILGPALVPIGAVGIPALTGLANQMGVAALAGGTMIAAFQGVGDALKAVEKARLDPTAANLQAAQKAMAQLGPDAREFVQQIQQLRPVLKDLRDTAAAGLFPGLIDGIDSLSSRADDLERILSAVSTATGDLLAEAGASLSSARWDEFFRFLETEAPQTLTVLGRTVGDLTHGLAELWMAFDPLNDDFSTWLTGIARGFDQWASGLSQTQGFEEFIDYVRTNGPQVAETLGALANAALQIAEAAAPLGGPVLAGLEAVAKVISTIADSNLGTPIMTAVGAFALLNRTVALSEGALSRFGRVGASGGALSIVQARATQARGAISGLGRDVGVMATTWATAGARSERESVRLKASSDRLRAAGANLGKGAAGVGAFALATSDLGNQMHVANTASLALVGTMAGPWGTAIGAAVGATLDLSDALGVTADDMQNFFDMAHARSGGDPAREIAALEAEVKNLQATMDQGHGLDLGITKVWWEQGAANAADKVELIQKRIEELRHEQELAAAANGEYLGGWGMFGSAVNSIVHDITEVGDAAHDASGGLDDLGTAMMRLDGFLTGRANLRDYQAALDDFAKSVKDNGKSFDITNEKGRANQAALDNIAASTVKLTEHMKRANKIKFLAGAVEDIRQVAHELGLPAAATQKVIDRLNVARGAAMGMTAAQRDLIRQYHLTPEQVQTVLKQIGMGKSQSDIRTLLRQYGLTPKEVRTFLRAIDQATGPINGVRGNLASLNGQNATVTITTRRVTQVITQGAKNLAGVIPGFADGGVVDYYASGGISERHVAQIAPAGAWRVWAEPETGGEAYLPLAYEKRPTTRPIAEVAVQRLGGEVSWYGDGGIRAAREAAVPGRFYDRPTAAAGGAASGGTLAIVGTLDTPFGPAQVRGVVREEIDQTERSRVRRAYAGRNGG